ncbi:hypothetical protein RZS08_30155, partial [Arthrospira platensis SPKY1]|nr:hypothetical protein [Arthrospira platensis SPKY1]
MKGNVPSRKKDAIPVGKPLMQYLERHRRATTLPLRYTDLLRYESSMPLIDQLGKDTLWETVYYPQSEFEEVNNAMKRIYALLKTDGDV